MVTVDPQIAVLKFPENIGAEVYVTCHIHSATLNKAILKNNCNYVVLYLLKRKDATEKFV